MLLIKVSFLRFHTQNACTNFKCQLIFQGLTYNQFKDSIDQINREILSALAAAQIVIPFPTAIEIQRDEV